MKRYGGFFPKICDMDNLKEAHKNARKDKTYYKEVKMVDSDPDFYLGQIQDMLMNRTYEVSEYVVSIISDKGKQRELMKLPYFPDRIIQWAIMLQIEDVFHQVFTNFTCASLKNRGSHKAMKLVDECMKDEAGTMYCLKIDVNKFYPSINHEILKNLLRKKFKDKALLELLDKIIDSIPEHTSQDDWKPETAPSLYKPIGFTDEGVSIWTQPLGARDAYHKGDIVSHNGKLWVNDIDVNTYEPGVYGLSSKGEHREGVSFTVLLYYIHYRNAIDISEIFYFLLEITETP